jgi:hypothetical protein
MYKTAKFSALASVALFAATLISFFSTGRFYYEGGYLLSYVAALTTLIAFVALGIWTAMHLSWIRAIYLVCALIISAAFISVLWLFTVGTSAGVYP